MLQDNQTLVSSAQEDRRPSARKSKGVSTLGMFILDSFEYDDLYRKTHNSCLEPGNWYVGGGGTYAAVGSRIWLPPDSITMVIHKGMDFPEEIEKHLESYSSSMFAFLHDTDHLKTTRALNTYSSHRRDFAYLTPKRQIKLQEIYEAKPTPPEFVHSICSPNRLATILEELQTIYPNWAPKFIWEPVPESCKPKNLEQLLKVIKEVTVFSPNELEAGELLGNLNPQKSNEEIENIGRYYFEAGCNAVVIRSGERGAWVIDGNTNGCWVPSLIKRKEEVVDQTGAGNSFLGGLMAGLALGEDLITSSCYGSISAGLTITQSGLPKITGKDPESGLEIWNNNIRPQSLLKELKQILRTN